MLVPKADPTYSSLFWATAFDRENAATTWFPAPMLMSHLAAELSHDTAATPTTPITRLGMLEAQFAEHPAPEVGVLLARAQRPADRMLRSWEIDESLADRVIAGDDLDLDMVADPAACGSGSWRPLANLGADKGGAGAPLTHGCPCTTPPTRCEPPPPEARKRPASPNGRTSQPCNY